MEQDGGLWSSIVLRSALTSRSSTALVTSQRCCSVRGCSGFGITSSYRCYLPGPRSLSPLAPRYPPLTSAPTGIRRRSILRPRPLPPSSSSLSLIILRLPNRHVRHPTPAQVHQPHASTLPHSPIQRSRTRLPPPAEGIRTPLRSRYIRLGRLLRRSEARGGIRQLVEDERVEGQ